MTSARSTLLAASSVYGQCAKRVEANITATSWLSEASSERIIGLGIARDWVSRAACMDTIKFTSGRMNRSARTPSFLEIIRYGFAWSGINAIFSRNDLLHLAGTPKSDSEIERFKLLFRAAALPTTLISARESTLHAILSEQTVTRLPLAAPGTAVSTLHAINAKYVPLGARIKGTGKKISEAASNGNLGVLDLPTLLYAFRNWSVHGSALDGSFGGRPKFNAFLKILNDSLAEVHLNTASFLLRLLCCVGPLGRRCGNPSHTI